MPLIYFEDFAVGMVADLGGKEVDAEEIRAFKARFDPLPAVAEDGEDIASALHCCGMLMRLMCDGYMLRAASVGAPGVDTVEVHKPVRAGDRLVARAETLEVRRSESRPGLGIVKSRNQLLDGSGAPVLTMTASAFFRCREGGR